MKQQQFIWKKIEPNQAKINGKLFNFEESPIFGRECTLLELKHGL